MEKTNNGKSIESIVQSYGDMIFDLCESVLWSPVNAQVVFRAVLRQIKSDAFGRTHSRYERPWVLRITVEKLKELSERHGRKLTASEQIRLNSTLSMSSRLHQFDAYLHRLTTDEQILLLLRDKYGLPYPEISSAMGVSESSLKMKRQQALRNLEEWLWDDHA